MAKKMVFKQFLMDEGNIITDTFLVIHLDCDIIPTKTKLISLIQGQLYDQCNNIIYMNRLLHSEIPEYHEYKFDESELDSILSSNGYYLGSNIKGKMDENILVMINSDDHDNNNYEEYLSLI